MTIYEKVCLTVFIETHEHLDNESVRLSAGAGYMPWKRLGENPGAVCDLCRESPDIKFVFFHIAYP